MSERTKYEVKTPWGWFRLDEGAYSDYLKGKLWLNWQPGAGQTGREYVPQTDCAEPVNISKEARNLYEAAVADGVYQVLCRHFSGKAVAMPYKKRMGEIAIDEMNLSVRSMNGLKRANTHTLQKLKELIECGQGLRAVRNLGIKSEKEIMQCFVSFCYDHLEKDEKLIFWQKAIEESQF